MVAVDNLRTLFGRGVSPGHYRQTAGSPGKDLPGGIGHRSRGLSDRDDVDPAAAGDLEGFRADEETTRAKA